MHSRLLLLLLCASLAACTPLRGGGGGGGGGGSADTDGDGISNADEGELGTDPNLADTDGDGWSDGEEVELDTDPLNGFSWDFGGERWPDFMAQAEAAGANEASSYGMNQVMPNFEYRDQFDQRVNLHQFYGYVILVDLSAGWCGPCQMLAQTADDLWEEMREDGFMTVHLMIDDWQGSGNVTPQFAAEWADEFGLTFPVLAERDGDVLNALSSSGLYEGAIPFQLILDQEMRIVDTITGVSPTPDDDLREIVQDLLDN